MDAPAGNLSGFNRPGRMERHMNDDPPNDDDYDDVPGWWFFFAPLVGIILLAVAWAVATGH